MPPQGLHQDSQYEARHRRWWPDVLCGLRDLYDEDTAVRTGARLEQLSRDAHRVRDADLVDLDYERLLRPDRLCTPEMIGYSADTERFAGDLAAVRDRLDYLHELGVTYLHLMPPFLARAGDDDGGYAVADYRQIRPILGTMADVRETTRQMRARGISLALDVICNHVADDHEWARRAKAGEERYRRYFHIFPDRESPDAYEQHLSQIFPDSDPGNFTWDDDLNAWVWTTFHSFQWDLNWSNPDVLVEMTHVILELANAGVEVIRLGAVAFVWKQAGTDCQGLPQVHSVTQVLRAVARVCCPAVSFEAEAVVRLERLPAYLGQGRWTGKLSELVYHDTLMVQIWSALAAKDARLAARALSCLPTLPPGTAWVSYLRCHDDIAWSVRDVDATAVGWEGASHRAFLSDWYAGTFTASRARGVVTRREGSGGEARIGGTAAALIGIQADEEDQDVPHAELDLAALRLAQAIVFGWGGIPVIWSGDELAAVNDPDGELAPGRSPDLRWTHRPRLDPQRWARRHDRNTSPGRAFTDLATMAAVRRELVHLHAATPSFVDEMHDRGVLPIRRPHPQGVMLQLYNVTPEWRFHPGARLAALGLDPAVDALTGQEVHPGPDGRVWLPPYAAWWLVAVTPSS
ncbi:Amylosucrase [Austwickia sp. TVS 96-490-7B]|uniref:alpha-amylase family glycosyl hydrolase n=1 Tax=Austwickia sp. TVS 96-490-7B TaxID=2830843 RepID=UPI001C591A13|nr:alpha-amylase family glycosyl hydrolase [Austwickia sp. TVS 96-490-7B]MBW3084465.1 Amylosucrase [Austwickia sp. TVS 96-490-7B]